MMHQHCTRDSHILRLQPVLFNSAALEEEYSPEGKDGDEWEAASCTVEMCTALQESRVQVAKHALAEEEGEDSKEHPGKRVSAVAVLMQATDSTALSPPERDSTQPSHCCREMDHGRRSIKVA